jgi:uncharacterized membrane protein
MNSKQPWLIPAGLIALSLVPVAAGAVRLTELASDAVVTPDNARFFATPLPVVIHIPSATIFCLLGAMQFAPSLRRRPWHRLAGRLVLPAGLAAALTGLWMAAYYDLPASENGLGLSFRLLAGAAMVISLILGFQAIRRRDIGAHRAWMMRGYALGLGAGTQVLTHVPWVILVGEPTGTARALLLGAGWVINLAIAEWFIYPRPIQVLPVQGWRSR